jgi:hypothetical protein
MGSKQKDPKGKQKQTSGFQLDARSEQMVLI